MQPRPFPDAHLAYLRTYAGYASHPHACWIHGWARAELERIESAAQALGAVTPETATSLAVDTPDAADPQREMF